jgi:hypothetical protein
MRRAWPPYGMHRPAKTDFMQKTLLPAFLALLAAAPYALAQRPTPEEGPPAVQERPAPAAPARSAEEELAALRPVPIGKRYLEQARKRLAVQLARLGRHMDASWFEDNALVARDFVADVAIMYALEFEEGAQLVSYGMMKSWGMDIDRLHQRALANLDRVHGEIAIKQVGKLPWLYVIDSGDGHAAGRVLLHWRWAELTLKLGEALILGMPTRDVVVFTSTLEPERIEQLRETVATIERHQGRPVSRRLFQWTPQGWQEFDADSEQAIQQHGQQAEQQRGAEWKVVGAAAKADTDVPRQAAETQEGGQSRQEDAGNQDRDQQGDQPLQHGADEKGGTTGKRR